MNSNNLNDSFLREKINELDEVFPQKLGDESLLWEDISFRLDKGKKKQLSWGWLSVAASVSILILVTVLFLVNKSSEESVITYRTEVQDSDMEKEMYESRQEENDAVEYLNEQCKVEKPVCNSEEFIELKQQLAEVNVKLEEIEKQKKLFGSDPALIKAQTAAENQKAYLLKELIQILRS